jgi:hypothetical protein
MIAIDLAMKMEICLKNDGPSQEGDCNGGSSREGRDNDGSSEGDDEQGGWRWGGSRRAEASVGVGRDG